jgi:drug/metabolite transporter (DMT)-like permease
MARSPSPHPSPLRGEGVDCGSLGANSVTARLEPERIVTGAHIGRVVLWMSGVLLSFSVMAVSIRALVRTFSVFEILAIRNAAGLTILLALACARPALRASLLPRRMGMHALRNSVHFAAQYAWALSITLLPLATVFALEFTNPAWLALLAAWLLRERMTTSRAGAVVLGFLGVAVILRPGLEAFQPAALIILGAAFGFAVSSIATKKLIVTETTFAILFWMNAMQLPMNLVGSSPSFVTRIDVAQALPMLGVAIAGVFSHFCLTNAFRHGDATIVVPLDFLRIPLIALIGWSLYGERLDGFVFAGAAIIIAGIFWNLRAEAARG